MSVAETRAQSVGSVCIRHQVEMSPDTQCGRLVSAAKQFQNESLRLAAQRTRRLCGLRKTRVPDAPVERANAAYALRPPHML
jgi:hypothetical protein